MTVIVALAFASCTGDERAATPTPSVTASITLGVAPPTAPASTAAPTTTRSLVASTTRDTAVFDKQISGLAFDPDTRTDVRSLITIVPYFVVATLKSAAPSELYPAGGIPEDRWFRGVSLTLEVTELRPLPASQKYPGPIATGRDIVVDFFVGAYTVESNRAMVDAIIRSTIDAAPFGATFALFVGPSVKADRWITYGPQGWAYVHDNERLSPVQRFDSSGNPSWWSTYDLPQLRTLIDEVAPR
jgi:hypothetical protein